jgi:hypothetical protein
MQRGGSTEIDEDRGLPMMPEIDANDLTLFLDRRAEDWTAEGLLEAFMKYGCAVVRQMVSIQALQELEAAIAVAYSVQTRPGFHVYDPDIASASGGRITGYEIVDTSLLRGFLTLVYQGQTYRRNAVNARRSQGVEGDETWQEPLGLHLDSHFHPFPFTVNFWVPFQECGVEAPGLQLLPLAYEETRAYAGYTGAIHRDGQRWNRGYFKADYFDADTVVKDFGENALLRPVMKPGDLVVSSNWIIHGTYRTPQMRNGRTNVEVRFIGDDMDVSAASRTA